VRGHTRVPKEKAFEILTELLTYQRINEKVSRRICDDENHADIVIYPEVLMQNDFLPVQYNETKHVKR